MTGSTQLFDEETARKVEAVYLTPDVVAQRNATLEALQQATSEMHRWLMQDYGLSERGASLLMGQALEYEVANVVDPRFTMVAKMRKSVLSGLKR